MTAPSPAMVQILLEAGASPAAAARAAEAIARGASAFEAFEEVMRVEEQLRTTISIEAALDELFQSEIAICGENGGGGNRTRVTCHAESALSRDSLSSSDDDDPSPPLVTPSAVAGEAAFPSGRAER